MCTIGNHVKKTKERLQVIFNVKYFNNLLKLLPDPSSSSEAFLHLNSELSSNFHNEDLNHFELVTKLKVKLTGKISYAHVIISYQGDLCQAKCSKKIFPVS